MRTALLILSLAGFSFGSIIAAEQGSGRGSSAYERAAGGLRSASKKKYAFDAVPLLEAVQRVATEAEIPFLLGTLEDRRVTAKATESPFRMLERLAKTSAIDLRWKDGIWRVGHFAGEASKHQEGGKGTPSYIAEAKKFATLAAKDYHFAQARLCEAVDLIATDLGIAVAWHPELEETKGRMINFSGKDRPFAALGKMAQASSLALRWDEAGWSLVAADADQPIGKTYRLRRKGGTAAREEEIVQDLQGILQLPMNRPLAPEDGQPALQMRWYPGSGTLVVIAMREQHQWVSDIIEAAPAKGKAKLAAAKTERDPLSLDISEIGTAAAEPSESFITAPPSD